MGSTRRAIIAAMYQHDALARRPLLGLRLARAAELRIQVAIEGGAAARAGVRAGDVLVAVDEQPLRSGPELARAARALRTGATVTLRVDRDGARLDLRAELPPFPVETLAGGEVLLAHVRVGPHRLRTLYALPTRSAVRGAVLYLQGVRPDSCEAPLDPADPTRRLVEALVGEGLAVVRVERSGVGDSEGPPPRETDLAMERATYDAALAGLRELDEVDPGRVFLFGHSFGGMVAPLVARDVAGVVAFGSSPLGWHDCMIGTTRRLRGEAEVARWSELFRLVFREGFTPERAFAAHPGLRDLRSRDSEGETMYGRHVSLFQQLEAIDLEAAWRAVSARVLALHGERDAVCSADEARAIAELARGEHVELPGVGHDLLADGAWDGRVAAEAARWMIRR
jgi:pimeloyl-ACP methyl ester carboxylesterase